MSVYSSQLQLRELRAILRQYLRLPFTGDTIPGHIMGGVLAHVRGGRVLNTYDFVDVIRTEDGCGWQVKSTKATTPVTWKRAKIPDAVSLIEQSNRSAGGLQALGDAIMEFCNRHAQEY